MMGGWYNDGMGWGGWLMMSLVMVAFWALVIVAVVAIFRSVPRSGPGETPQRPRDALTILDERFARGEIDTEEYHARQIALRR